MAFKVTDLVVRIQINTDRDRGRIELLGDGKAIAQAAIDSCGRTNMMANVREPGFAFAGKVESNAELKTLKQQLRAMLQKLDDIEIHPPDAKGGR